MDEVKLLSKIKGGLIGGAIGDALGGPVEFLTEEAIFNTYGQSGITDYKDGKGYVTDDTQMSLFTAEGLLRTRKKCRKLGYNPARYHYVEGIYENYLDWYYTQTGEWVKDGYEHSELLKYEELLKRRAPGATCLSALASGQMGSIENKINTSKGCGGIMRVAPIAFFLANKPKDLYRGPALAADVSALTHGHELGYIPSWVLCHMLRSILSGTNMLYAMKDSLSAVKIAFPKAKHMDDLIPLVEWAIRLAQKPDTDDLEAIFSLGGGWVAEETLAIAVYCALKYKDDFEKAITVSVHHGGDSDSTGAVTGNIVGAYLGIEGIPKKYIENLELTDLMNELATRMITEY